MTHINERFYAPPPPPGRACLCKQSTPGPTSWTKRTFDPHTDAGSTKETNQPNQTECPDNCEGLIRAKRSFSTHKSNLIHRGSTTRVPFCWNRVGGNMNLNNPGRKKGERRLPGSRPSKQSYIILTFSGLQRGHFSCLWILSRWES